MIRLPVVHDLDTAPVNLRPSWIRAGAPLLMTAVGMPALFVMLATASAARTDLRPASFDRAAALLEEAANQPEASVWAMPEEPLARTGYRRGHPREIDVVPLGPEEIEVEVSTAEAFLAMRAAAAESGVELHLESGFRTREDQAELYRAWRKGKGNRAARPGRSNHQSGRALDIAVITVPGAGEWLEENAAHFGFKRTVRGEPWHWEYVEIPRARKRATAKQRARKRAAAKRRARKRAAAKRRARKRAAAKRRAHKRRRAARAATRTAAR